MTRARKRLLIAAVALFLAVPLLSFAKNILAKIAIERGVQLVTGLPLRMSGFDFSILKTSINIDDLKLYNPKGFVDRVMIDIPNIYVDYNLLSFIRGKAHLYDMKLNLKEFTVVKNKEGKLNLESIKAIQPQKEGSGGSKAPAPGIQIDNLELKVNKVVYKDYSAGGRPFVREFNVDIDRRYTNITDINSLVRLSIVQALMNTTISTLTSFDIKGLSDMVIDSFSKSVELSAKAAGQATIAVGKAGEAITGAAGKIKKIYAD